MSEYQYYEFEAVDRPLTSAQMAELRKVSSRGDITPTSYSNVYNYGDFRGDPKRWMELYFDAFLHLTNWGTRWLMLRVPAALVDVALVRRYLGGETSEVWKSGPNLVLSFRIDDEEPEWEEGGEGWLSTLAMLREHLILGDHRCLYLAWLLKARWLGGAYADDDESDDLLRAEEPPVPPGLGELSEPLLRFADFLLIDGDLIAAAAERSAAMRDTSIPKKQIARWVSALPVEEKDAIVLRLLDDDAPHQGIELRRRMERELREARHPGDEPTARPRTLRALIERGEALAEERRRKEAEQRAKEKIRKEREAAKKRRKHLESLVGMEKRLWADVGTLIETKLPKNYNHAVEVLTDLQGLAEMAGTQDDFARRIGALAVEHDRKRTFIERLRKAKLL
jgi:hypothetical protein